MNIPINSVMGYIGLALLVFGVFMVLAGFDVISIQQVTVKKGRKTWVLGIVFALLGIWLLLPEFGTSTTTTDSPTAIPLAATEILQPDQQAKCGTLKLEAILPSTIVENEMREYKLIGAGFCGDTSISIATLAFVGNDPQNTPNGLPSKVSSDGTWMTVYINPTSAPDQNGVEVQVKNPDGNSASLFAGYQR
jgi:hypothetical protein